MKEIILSTNKLSKSFSTGGNQQHVLKNIDVEIYKGDFTVIMGSSGAGKSTLLYALSGMGKPSLGSVLFDQQDITTYSNDKLAIFRRQHCGFVFQQMYLLDSMSVMDNALTTGLLIHNNKQQVLQKAQVLFSKVQIASALYHKFPAQISGGEAQRVAIVRALMNDPVMLFADEPTGALNSKASQAVLDVFTVLNQEGQSIVMVTHDIKSALRANRILYLKDGIICGDLDLGNYQEKDEARHQKLTTFLEEMGW